MTMSNVIKADFGNTEDKAGYLLDDRDKSISGVYNGDIAAMKLNDDEVVVGTKTIDGIDNPTLTTMKEMNEFCLMWLLIFDQSVIKEDK
jgi:hypothetical protein